jgi:hypothetical protein
MSAPPILAVCEACGRGYVTVPETAYCAMAPRDAWAKDRGPCGGRIVTLREPAPRPEPPRDYRYLLDLQGLR